MVERSSVTSCPDHLFNIWQFIKIIVSPMAKIFPRKTFAIWTDCQRDLKTCQSGEILPNLITLIKSWPCVEWRSKVVKLDSFEWRFYFNESKHLIFIQIRPQHVPRGPGPPNRNSTGRRQSEETVRIREKLFEYVKTVRIL